MKPSATPWVVGKPRKSQLYWIVPIYAQGIMNLTMRVASTHAISSELAMANAELIAASVNIMSEPSDE